MLRYGKVVLFSGIIIGLIVSVGFGLLTPLFTGVDPFVYLINLVGFLGYLVVGTAVFRMSPMWPTELDKKWYLVCLGWGGGAAAAVASIVGIAIIPVVHRLNLAFFEASFGGAYPEEIAKLVGVALILLVSGRFSRPWHGFVIGGIVGLGFEVIENFFYAFYGATLDPNSDITGAVSMWGTRTIAGPGLHVCLTAISGLAMGYAIFLADVSMRKRLAYLFAGLGMSFGLHFAWNVIFGSFATQVIWWVCIGAILYGIFIACWVHCVRQVKAEGNGPITMLHHPITSLDELMPATPPAPHPTTAGDLVRTAPPRDFQA